MFKHSWDLAVKLLKHLFQYSLCAKCYTNLLKGGKIQLLNQFLLLLHAFFLFLYLSTSNIYFNIKEGYTKIYIFSPTISSVFSISSLLFVCFCFIIQNIFSFSEYTTPMQLKCPILFSKSFLDKSKQLFIPFLNSLNTVLCHLSSFTLRLTIFIYFSSPQIY